MGMRLIFAVSLLALAGAMPAQAAVMVYGDGPEHVCYVAARSGVSLVDGLDNCNRALEKALVLSDRAATFVNRGVVLHLLGRENEAMQDFNESLRLVPDQADAWLNRGVTKVVLRQLPEALADIEKGLSLGPSELAIAYYDRAIVYEQMGRLTDAYHDYQKAVEISPGFLQAINALSRFVVTRSQT